MIPEELAFVEEMRSGNRADDWTTIQVDVDGNVGGMNIVSTWDSETQSAPETPIQASVALFALRRATADPERGAWLTAHIHIPRTGHATFCYDWMTEPKWEAIDGLDDVLYFDDLKEFPRTAENIPDWYPRPS